MGLLRVVGNLVLVGLTVPPVMIGTAIVRGVKGLTEPTHCAVCGHGKQWSRGTLVCPDGHHG